MSVIDSPSIKTTIINPIKHLVCSVFFGKGIIKSGVGFGVAIGHVVGIFVELVTNSNGIFSGRGNFFPSNFGAGERVEIIGIYGDGVGAGLDRKC